MPKYDLSDVKSVKLLITQETSQKIADLRHHFRSTGRQQDSLAYVCQEAVALLHSQVFSVAPRPSDSSHFLRTVSKEHS